MLGLNPGGPPNEETIGGSLAGLPAYTDNAYLDEGWAGFAVGEAPVQQNVSFLAEILNVPVRAMCASNLVFRRAVHAHRLHMPGDANICWPVHKLILEIVQPEVLVVFGNGNPSPYTYLLGLHRQQTGAWPLEAAASAQWGSWLCKSFGTNLQGHDVLVIGLPHFSWYRLAGRDGVADWITDQMA
jgi:hypothetical protein